MLSSNDFELVSEYSKTLRNPAQSLGEDVFGKQCLISYLEELRKFMRKNNGMGIAAPQVGHSDRMFIIQNGYVSKPRFCINPKIIQESDDFNAIKEGCLSFPGIYLKVNRVKEIRVSYFTPDGKNIVEDLDGVESICFQHELDHLNGVLFIDHVGPTALKLAKSKAKKFAKRRR
jgi:peptide deformylase